MAATAAAAPPTLHATSTGLPLPLPSPVARSPALTPVAIARAASAQPWIAAVSSIFEASKLPFVSPVHLPRQDNSYDCGLFALQYTESFCLPHLPHIASPYLQSSGMQQLLFGAHWFPHQCIDGKREAIKTLLLQDVLRRPECAVAPPAPAASSSSSSSAAAAAAAGRQPVT